MSTLEVHLLLLLLPSFEAGDRAHVTWKGDPVVKVRGCVTLPMLCEFEMLLRLKRRIADLAGSSEWPLRFTDESRRLRSAWFDVLLQSQRTAIQLWRGWVHPLASFSGGVFFLQFKKRKLVYVRRTCARSSTNDTDRPPGRRQRGLAEYEYEETTP
jgi:hypothetical protein